MCVSLCLCVCVCKLFGGFLLDLTNFISLGQSVWNSMLVTLLPWISGSCPSCYCLSPYTLLGNFVLDQRHSYASILFCVVYRIICKPSALINSGSTDIVQINHYYFATRVHLSFFRCETFLGISYVHLGKPTVESSVQRSLRSPIEALSLELRWRAFLQCLFPIALGDWRAGTRDLENGNISEVHFSLHSLPFIPMTLLRHPRAVETNLI